MFLYINTALSFIEIALFSKEELFFVERKQGGNDAKEVLDMITQYDLTKIEGILICKGPGRFISLRVGASYAQTLAYIKNILLIPFTTLEYFQGFLKKAEQNNVLILQQSGLYDLFVNGELKRFEDLKEENMQWIGDIRSPQLLPKSWKQKELPQLNLEILNRLLEISHSIPVTEFKILYGKEPSIG